MFARMKKRKRKKEKRKNMMFGILISIWGGGVCFRSYISPDVIYLSRFHIEMLNPRGIRPKREIGIPRVLVLLSA